MDAKTFEIWLKSKNACSGSYAETSGKSLQEWWDATTRPEWMVWVLRRLPVYQDDKKSMVRIAIASARSVLDLAASGDARPRLAIEAAEKWLHDPSEANRSNAYAAAYAANAAYAAAYSAAAYSAAAYAAAANANAYAAAAAAAAAYAAAYSAAAAANAYAAAAAAAYAKKTELCAAIRKMIPEIISEAVPA